MTNRTEICLDEHERGYDGLHARLKHVFIVNDQRSRDTIDSTEACNYRRFDYVHLDIIGFPLSRGFRYCLTLIDPEKRSRWPEPVPLSNITADTVAKFFVTPWVCSYCLGSSKIITTDQGTQFESKLFKALATFIGTKCTRTTAYHPESKGAHRTLA